MADRAVAVAPRVDLKTVTAAVQRLPEEIRIARDVYAPDLSDAEFVVFVADAQSRGLSIINREIVAIKFKGKMTPFVTLNGLRKLADNSGILTRVDGPYWCGPDRKWVDVWLDEKPPAAARFSVWTTRSEHPVHGIAVFKERKQEYWDKNTNQKRLSPTWESMPALMLGKCAEADAMRRAQLVPNDIHLWSDDEPYDPRAAKNGGLRHIHEVGKKRGLDHDDVRSVVKAIRPGTESLTDEDITSRDLLAGGDLIEVIDDGPLQQMVETEHIGDVETESGAIIALTEYATSLGWTPDASELLALSMYPKEVNGRLHTSIHQLNDDQLTFVYEQIEGIGSVIDTETDSDEATPEVEMANRIAAVESKSDLNAIKVEMKESGISPDWLQTMWKRASLTAKADPKPEATATAQPELLSTPSNQLTN